MYMWIEELLITLREHISYMSIIITYFNDDINFRQKFSLIIFSKRQLF
jgi:hypothetical protein